MTNHSEQENSSNRSDVFEIFPWNPTLETGIEIIDHQHARLVALINQLAATLTRNDDNEIVRVFDELSAYASYHFETEEFVWREVLEGDDILAEHEHAHENFLPHVLELKEKDTGKTLRETVENVMAFLIRWLAYHIIDSDKNMALIYHHVKAGRSIEEAKAQASHEMVDSARIMTETVLKMFDTLSSRTLEMIREREQRVKAEKELKALNRKLAEMATTDQLTGLSNRRHLELIFENEVKRARRYGEHLTFILLDVDFFKKLNDNYGHAEGDVALKELGTLFNEIGQRPGDYAFRVGGEEFAFLIYGLKPEDGARFADKVREAVYARKLTHAFNDAADRLTISLGVETRIPEQATTLDDYMSTADRRLYMAKEAGRNIAIAEG